MRQVSIITGAASGIGRACAERLHARGGAVALIDVNRDGLNRLVRLLAENDTSSRLLPLILDVRSQTDMEHMVNQTLERFGQIDHLIASAGILRTHDNPQPVSRTSLDSWSTVIDINLTGTFLSNRAVLRPMIKQRRGDIINISSVSGTKGRAYDAPYCASKFGVIGLSESLAEEVASYGVRIQTLLPDAVDTPFSAGIRATPMLHPSRVADMITYMLDLPRDAFLLNPIIGPFKSRKRRQTSDQVAAQKPSGDAEI